VTMADPNRFKRSLADLEHEAHVPREQQVESQAVDPPRDYMDPEDLDRRRLLADPAGAGRLHPRR